MSEQEPWVSVDEVDKHLGVARDSVCRWIDAKGLPAHRVDRLWNFKLSDLHTRGRVGGVVEEESESGEQA